MESISSVPEMTEINIDSLPGLELDVFTFNDVILPTDVTLAP